MESLLQSKFSFPPILKFVPRLSSEPVNFYFMPLDVSLLSPVPTVLRLQLCSVPCRPWCTAVICLLFLLNHPQSQVHISELHSLLTPVYIFSEFRLYQFIQLLVAQITILFLNIFIETPVVHTLSSFVRPTYKISSFTLRGLIYIGLNGNIIFTQECQDQTLN